MANKNVILGALVVILLISVFSGVLSNSIENAKNQYKCLDSSYNIQSTDLLLCTNSTYACLNESAPVLNISYSPPLCTNETGAGVYNESASSGFLAYNESATYVGLSTVEGSLIGLTILFLVISAIILVGKEAGLIKPKV